MRIGKIEITENSVQQSTNITILDDAGNALNQFKTSSLIGTKQISNDRKKVVFSTLIPDNSIYYYDQDKNEIIWKYKNHSHKVVLGIGFMNNLIVVSTGKSMAEKMEEYQLQSDGTLEQKCQNQLDSISRKKKLPFEEAIPEIMRYFNSEYRTVIFRSIIELQSYTYDKKMIKHIPILINEIPTLLKSKDKEVFDLTWRLIRRIILKKPELIDLILSDILSRIKEIKSEYHNPYLHHLEELCQTNHAWIKTEISNVEKIFEESEDEYEKKDAKGILELYNRKTEKIPRYQFPISSHKLELDFKEYKNKTKDHLISFSENGIVSRIGWTRPSRILRLDSDLKQKWKIEIPGRVRNIKSDSIGSVITESTFTKNEDLGSIFDTDIINPEQDGRFVSSMYIIDISGKIVRKLENIVDSITVINITSKNILIWTDPGLTIQCLSRSTAEKLWEKSFFSLVHDKYSIRALHHYEDFDKFLVVRILNEQKEPVVPSVISVLDGSGNILSEFEDDGFPSNEQLKEFNPTHGDSKGIRIGIELPTPHYPIYHALITPDGNHIIAAHYNGQVASWSIDGRLEWVFACKNKVKLGLSITNDGLISALCENGDYFLIENGKQIMHSVLEIDQSKSYQVFSLEKYSGLSYDKKIMFFDREGLVLEKEFQEKIRLVKYNSDQKLLVISANSIFLAII